MPRTNIEPGIRGRAHALRRKPTDAERKMWWLLRSMKPLGMHFRRQAPKDPTPTPPHKGEGFMPAQAQG
jgi:very-short-patch-repair endonuclease